MKIREYKKEDLFEVSKIHVDSWKSTYSNILPKNYLSNMTYEEQKEKWINRLINNENSNEFMLVAENENGEIIGFSSASKCELGSQFDSILFTLYIRNDYKSKGIGKSLIKEVANKLISLGANNLILSTLAENKACYFYEHLGGVKKEEKLIKLAGINLKEVIYKWDDINALSNL